ncbi:hypothetical protein NX059_011918 [Plenodomus lindquistii]|nr:hypothetical protein NX059_011918 [Plenodomus lindquistii]
MSVIVEQYDPNWPEEFERIKKDLIKYLKDVNYLSIEHVGSTSVPGLVAKPVIDVDIIVTRSNIQPAIDALIENGNYDHLGELGITDRHVLKDPKQPTSYNIHICVDGAPQTRNHLGLRDTLRTNPDLREEYARVKLDLAAHSTNIIDYIVGKTPIIQKILRTSTLLTPDELLTIRKANVKGERYGSIHTPRLLLREFESKDISGYYALESSAENAKYQSWPPRTKEQARQLVLDNIRNHNDVPRTIYELAVEHNGHFIGRVGAKTSQANSDSLPGEQTIKHVTHANLWFSFLPSVWGQGFATEAMTAFIDALKERLQGEGKVELEIECDPRNEGCWKLAERLGFERFSLTKEKWEGKGGWVDSLVLRRVVGDLATESRHVRRESMVSNDGRDAFAASLYAPKGTGQSAELQDSEIGLMLYVHEGRRGWVAGGVQGAFAMSVCMGEQRAWRERYVLVNITTSTWFSRIEKEFSIRIVTTGHTCDKPKKWVPFRCKHKVETNDERRTTSASCVSSASTSSQIPPTLPPTSIQFFLSSLCSRYHPRHPLILHDRITLIMSQHYSDDVTMGDGNGNIVRESPQIPDDNVVKALTDTQLAELDRKAREHYQIKLALPGDKVMYRPSLETIYFNQADTFLSHIPENLPLEILLSRYNDLAAHNFAAIQDSEVQDDQLTSLIWHYGLDEQHSFNRYFASTRYNIIMMAYVWACKFDTQYCDPGAKKMIGAFMKAWLSTLEAINENRNDFTAQENFIQIWKDSEYDLITFTDAQIRVIRRLLGELKERSLPSHVSEKVFENAEKMLHVRREGRISEEDWEKYGAKIVMLWTLTLKTSGDRQVAVLDAKRTQTESTNTLQAKMMAEQAARRVKARGESGNVLAQVPWDDSLLVALLEPIDDSARDPKKLARKGAKMHQRAPWMEASDFIKLLKSAVFQQDLDEMVGETENMSIGKDGVEAGVEGDKGGDEMEE